MAYGTGAEFYGLERLPDPGPKPVVKASGLRKFHCQTSFEGEDNPPGPASMTYRGSKMAQDSQRAMRWFAEQERQGVKIHWHTLQFSIQRSGMEPHRDVELWRWEVWAE